MFYGKNLKKHILTLVVVVMGKFVGIALVGLGVYLTIQAPKKNKYVPFLSKVL
jgi:hypothetical protein